MSEDNQEHMPSADDIAAWHKNQHLGQRKAAEERMREMDEELYADASQIGHLFGELSPEQIKTVVMVAESCVNAIGYAGMVKGMAISTFMTRGLAANGDSFDDLFKTDEHSTPMESSSTTVNIETGEEWPSSFKQVPAYPRDNEKVVIDKSDPTGWYNADKYMEWLRVHNPERYQKYALWGVYPCDSSDTDDFGRELVDSQMKMLGFVRCTGAGCGWVSESLEARMETDPQVDGCTQCKKIAQWGHK